MTLPYLMSEPQAASQLGISANTLRGIRARGEIRFTRVGARVRYTDDHLREYLERGECDSRSETTGSPSDEDQTSGAERGSVVKLDRRAASLLAQRTFGKPR